MKRFVYQALSIIALGGMIFLSHSCQNCDRKTEVSETDTTITDTVPADVSFNKEMTDVALFIAGMPVDTASHLYPLTQTESWKSYKTRMDKTWTAFYDDVDSTIRPWVEAEIPNLSDTFNTLFYPFSGPDFINADIFFPNVTNHIFFGLEPPGSLPDPLNVKESDLPDYYSMYEQSIFHIINLSFFRTHSMKVDLSSMEVDGAAPVILLFMARSGKKIIDIRPFRFAEDGTLAYDSIFNNFNPGEKFGKGVEIKFRNENDPKVQNLVYFSADISDGGLDSKPGIKKYLQNIESNCLVYIKSASYLLHDPFFETIKALILEKAGLLLQDDSGMPFRFLDQSLWKIKLYGLYDRPIPIFARYFEKPLFDAYQAAKTTELNFRRGYAKKTNLLLARKINNAIAGK